MSEMDKSTVSSFHCCSHYDSPLPVEAIFGDFGDFKSHSRSHRHSKIKQRYHVDFVAATSYNFAFMTALTASLHLAYFPSKNCLYKVRTVRTHHFQIDVVIGP